MNSSLSERPKVDNTASEDETQCVHINFNLQRCIVRRSVFQNRCRENTEQNKSDSDESREASNAQDAEVQNIHHILHFEYSWKL
jgi:hypothetical protein